LAIAALKSVINPHAAMQQQMLHCDMVIGSKGNKGNQAPVAAKGSTTAQPLLALWGQRLLLEVH
jgi:hypothetical protein